VIASTFVIPLKSSSIRVTAVLAPLSIAKVSFPAPPSIVLYTAVVLRLATVELILSSPAPRLKVEPTVVAAARVTSSFTEEPITVEPALRPVPVPPIVKP